MTLNIIFSVVVNLICLTIVWGARPITPQETTTSNEIKAVCIIRNDTVVGNIVLRQAVSQYGSQSTNDVELTGNVQFIQQSSGQNSNRYHGFHVHMYGDLSNGCANAGGHFNPFNKQHGGPNDTNRHVGDLGNIIADGSGHASISITDSQLSLCGPNSIMGRAIVVHALRDDLGNGGNEESKRTGNAGARLGCCIIGYAS